MPPLSFMSANFVARQLGYSMTEGWMQGDRATNAWFAPLATYAERFDALLAEVAALGFERIDLWAAHLHYRWATPEHIEIARQLLRKHNLRVASYAGGFGDNAVEFRACCRLAAALEIPVLGGGSPFLAADRAAFVATLREFGLVFGIENHPEKTPAELLAKLGEGDEDVLGVAVDTGWFGTQGYDAPTALRELASRLKHVHLKDVKAPGGHETCRLGNGCVDIPGCLRALREVGYVFPVSLEHEPEMFDPTPDVRASVERIRAWTAEMDAARRIKPLRVAIVGCGNIANAYAKHIRGDPHLALVGVHDIDSAKAAEFAAKFDTEAFPSLDAILQNPDVDAVVNLTIHHAHFDVTRRCLEARKHVHTEKPMALSHADGRTLARLARKMNRRLSCAPVTWLGEAQQTAWKLIRGGRLGTVRVALAEVMWGRIESWHPNPEPFYEVGVVGDVAVYPLTLLTAWFGPVRRVLASAHLVHPDRVTKENRPFSITTPEFQVIVLTFASGLVARITASFYCGQPSRHNGLELHGDAANLYMDRWDVFSSGVYVGDQRQPSRRVPLLRPPFPGIGFGEGISELAAAIREKRPHRCGADQAAHVLEILDAVKASATKGRAVALKSSFPAPEPLDWAR